MSFAVPLFADIAATIPPGGATELTRLPEVAGEMPLTSLTSMDEPGAATVDDSEVDLLLTPAVEPEVAVVAEEPVAAPAPVAVAAIAATSTPQLDVREKCTEVESARKS